VLKRVAPYLLALLVALSCAPSTVCARDNWVSVRSKHLLVIGNGSEKDIRLMAVRLEQFREVVTQLFTRPGSDSAVPTTVIVFKDDASYRPFKTNQNNAGYFQPGQDVNYITLSAETRGEQDWFNIIFHEYTHLITNNSIGLSPAWFNEGLASLYEASGEKNGHIRGYTNWRLPALQEAIREGGLLPFPKMMALSSDDFYGGRGNGRNYSHYYAQARYLCYHLQEQDLLVKFYKAYVAGVKTDPSGVEALKSVLNERDLKAFQQRWEKMVLGLRVER